ncbi:putative protein OS=Streptomyces aurantiogriseus OX=66870 GN=GCM10010251_02770 PE=4 SV=1 [Streptomyces aurantiogriseus]
MLSTLVLRQDHRTPAEPAPTATPTATPRAGQWVHHDVRRDIPKCVVAVADREYSEAGGMYLASGPRGCALDSGETYEENMWFRYDGLARAFPDMETNDPDDVQVRDDPAPYANGDMLSPQATDAMLAELPDDPDAALALILKRSIPSRISTAHRLTQAQRDFHEVVEILSGASYVPADKARTLYRIITGLEGATKPVNVTDGADRTVLAIGIDGNFRDYTYERNSMQVLLDPDTYAYRGVRWVAGMDYYVDGKASNGPFVKKGTQIGMATRMSTTVVDKAGDRK